jgi:hypothetical protein
MSRKPHRAITSQNDGSHTNKLPYRRCNGCAGIGGGPNRPLFPSARHACIGRQTRFPLRWTFCSSKLVVKSSSFQSRTSPSGLDFALSPIGATNSTGLECNRGKERQSFHIYFRRCDWGLPRGSTLHAHRLQDRAESLRCSYLGGSSGSVKWMDGPSWGMVSLVFVDDADNAHR